MISFQTLSSAVRYSTVSLWPVEASDEADVHCRGRIGDESQVGHLHRLLAVPPLAQFECLEQRLESTSLHRYFDSVRYTLLLKVLKAQDPDLSAQTRARYRKAFGDLALKRRG